MREEHTENKMNIIDKYKYHVVKFLENPFKDTERANCKDVCVPRSWLKWCSPEDNIVKVWYPTQDLRNIEKKVRKREKKSDQWASFLSVLKYSSDIYEDVKMYIRNKEYLQKKNTEDHTPLSEKVEERPCKTTSSVIQNKATVEDMLDAICKFANTCILKRKAPADSDKPTHKKRYRVNEVGKSVDQIAGPSGQAFKNQTLTHKGSNEDLCIQETPVVKKSNNRNSTQKKQIVNQNASKENYSLNPKLAARLPILAECFKLIQEVDKCLGYSLVREIITNVMNTDNSRSALSSDATVQAPKLNEEKINEKQTEENDSDDDCNDEGDRDNDDRDEDDRDDDDRDEDDCDDDDDHGDEDSEENDSDDDCNDEGFHDNGDRDEDDRDDDDRDEDGCDDDDEHDYEESEENDSDDDCNDKGDLDNGDRDDDDRDDDDCDEDDCDDDADRDEDGSKNSSCNEGNNFGDDEPRTKKKCPKQPKSFVLPPEYKANRSRWTLKYREPAPGLVELMEHSGVYVQATHLENCKILGYALGRMLLTEVFTKSALRTCSWTGQRAPGYCSQGITGRPGLHERAREVLLDFVIKHSEEENYYVCRRALTKNMYSYMLKMRPNI